MSTQNIGRGLKTHLTLYNYTSVSLKLFLARTDWHSNSFCCYENKRKKKRCRLSRRIRVSGGKKELVQEGYGLHLTSTGAWNRSGNTLVQSLNSWPTLVEAFALIKTKLQHIFKEENPPSSHELSIFRCSHTRTAPHSKVICDRFDWCFMGTIISALQFSELSLFTSSQTQTTNNISKRFTAFSSRDIYLNKNIDSFNISAPTSGLVTIKETLLRIQKAVWVFRPAGLFVFVCIWILNCYSQNRTCTPHTGVLPGGCLVLLQNVLSWHKKHKS